MMLQAIRRWLMGLCLLLLPCAVFAWKGEAAAFTTHDTFSNKNWQSIGFQQTYNTAPVVVTIPTTQGADSATIRIRNVTTSGFENSPVETRDRDGPHVAMDSAYIAVEPGIHVLPDGNVIVAGFIDTSRVQHGNGVSGATGWETVNFGYTFSAQPTVIAAIQTMNNEQGEGGSLPPYVSSIPWLTVAIDNISSTQFNVALERSQSNHGNVTQNERIGYIAMLNGANGAFIDTQNRNIQYLSETTPASIRGWDNNDYQHYYGVPFASAPLSLVTKNTRNNPDGGWLRRNGATTASRINLRVDEDDDHDNERSINPTQAEAAGILTFSRNFVAEFLPGFTVEKTSMVISDPVNGSNNPKAIPGAVIEYSLIVTNTGHDYSDSNQFEITDVLPAYTSLLVSDIPGGSGGPVRFTDGTTSSRTQWNFGGLSALADSIDFSSDGSDYSYAPVPDGQGADSAVTHIKLKPQGAFAAYPPAHPSATYSYRVIIR
ncbi:MAG: hypothetical protein R3F02_17955 [Thiolinea sp.]